MRDDEVVDHLLAIPDRLVGSIVVRPEIDRSDAAAVTHGLRAEGAGLQVRRGVDLHAVDPDLDYTVPLLVRAELVTEFDGIPAAHVEAKHPAQAGPIVGIAQLRRLKPVLEMLRIRR